jgi:hypothetical protein
MDKEEVESLLQPETFTPFVLTTKNGFSFAVKDPHRVLVGLSMLTVKLDNGRLHHVPFGAIDHVDETGERLG